MLKTILLVEDNEDDVFLMRQAVRRSNISNPMQVAEDGQQALDYLQGVGKYIDRALHPLPFMVLLDLRLPFVPGLEVLEWIRHRPELETMLVVVLTASREDSDVDTAYRLGANSYLVKPPTPEKLAEMVKSLGDYWIRHNEPPKKIGLPA
ncbi:MAG: response regulator receiver protein [Verrucomicrobiales bacterium]|nr:response regulator receiver protein [Verrucomicrobiales bacterium]